MEKNYEWQIISLICYKTEEELSNVVNQIKYTRICYVNTDSGRIQCGVDGVAGFGQPDPDNFIPYNELTQEICFGWLDQVVNVQLLDEALALKLDEILTSNVVTPPLPW